MDLLIQKSEIRKQKKAKRDGLTGEERRKRSHQICEALWQSPLLQEAQAVYCYAPVGSEVDIWELVERMWAAGKRLAFPRVLEAAVPDMEFFEVKSRQELKEGAFHVEEPETDGRAPVDWKGALVLVPGVAFDRAGARCGYGKGYYDRYFASHPELVRVGVAFECQLSEKLSDCCEETDVRLEYVQTECCCYEAVRAMAYGALVEKISGSRRFGRAPGIECSGAVMELLGHPDRDLKFVHIAGTNGKGSVSAFLREICEKAGLRVGLFTSPHLQEFTERIQIGHEQIPREKVRQLGQIVMAANDRLMVSRGINLTMFDYCLAIALLYFKEQQADLVILETGMGGRLDSTNMIQAPVVSVITGIGLEHTEYLGDTVSAIAAEKAGILKPGTKAVLMEQEPQSLEVLLGRCEALGICYRVSGSVDAEGSYRGVHYEIGMPGSYQRKNAAAAIEAAMLLAENGYPQITGQVITAGIRDARWPGRMELLREHPWVLLDGAHNVHGVTALAKSLRELGQDTRYTFFMGVMADKDYETMVELILPLAKQIYALAPDSDRALPAEKLCALIREKGGRADVCTDEAHLVELVHTQPEQEKCVVFGSLYLIGEIRQRLMK
ncbi:MAG: 5-formyltetrahydrofolate cyclo-ligase [Lachnospiraceae bacterium]|nr:5-formyltetrahydrofolate cyclo-ligase [bacterium]MDY5516545.1 5-formyltetrahydrofolate cyclo-ligase [Lachnospiraceae bacterium]